MIIEYNYDPVVELSNNGTASNVHCCTRGLFKIKANGIDLKRIDGNIYANINNHPKYINVAETSGGQKLQPDTRTQGQAGISTYDLPDGSRENLCVNIKDNLKPQSGSVPQYILSKGGMNNYRYNTFKITPQIAQTIINQSGNNSGYLTINVSEASSNQHTQAARIIVKDPKGNIYYDSCINGDCGNRNTGDFQVSYCNTGFS